jgi:hypothetical protein
MKIPRRRFLHLAAGAVALPAVSQVARGQTYPTRPVRIIVGFPPGGPTDIAARLIGQAVSFFGGFRTPALVPVDRSASAGIRNPSHKQPPTFAPATAELTSIADTKARNR